MSKAEFEKMIEGMERKFSLRKGMNANNREESIDGLFVDPEPVIEYRDSEERAGYDIVTIHHAVYQGIMVWLQTAVWHSKKPYSAWGKRDYILSLLAGENVIRDQRMGPSSKSLLEKDTGYNYPALVKIGAPVDIRLTPRIRTVTYCTPNGEYKSLYGDPESIIDRLVEMKYISGGKVEAEA